MRILREAIPDAMGAVARKSTYPQLYSLKQRVNAGLERLTQYIPKRPGLRAPIGPLGAIRIAKGTPVSYPSPTGKMAIGTFIRQEGNKAIIRGVAREIIEIPSWQVTQVKEPEKEKFKSLIKEVGEKISLAKEPEKAAAELKQAEKQLRRALRQEGPRTIEKAGDAVVDAEVNLRLAREPEAIAPTVEKLLLKTRQALRRAPDVPIEGMATTNQMNKAVSIASASKM